MAEGQGGWYTFGRISYTSLRGGGSDGIYGELVTMVDLLTVMTRVYCTSYVCEWRVRGGGVEGNAMGNGGRHCVGIVNDCVRLVGPSKVKSM